MPNPNLELLVLAAERLRELLPEIVFVGGCATGLLIDDPAVAPVRATYDVDVIAEIGSYAEYTVFSGRLRDRRILSRGRSCNTPTFRFIPSYPRQNPHGLNIERSGYRRILRHTRSTAAFVRVKRPLNGPRLRTTGGVIATVIPSCHPYPFRVRLTP
jgi:hypothetical protein